MDYINTSHPNFIGGSKALEAAQQQVKSHRPQASVPRSKDGLDVDRMQLSEKNLKSRTFLAKSAVNGVVSDQGVRPAADIEKLGSSDQSGNASGSSWGISSLFGSSESRAPAKDIPSSKPHGAPSHNSAEFTFSMIQLKEPPMVLKPPENVSEQEAVEIATTKILLKSYYDVVRRNIEHAVITAIMRFLVNHSKRELHNVFIRKLYRESQFEELLREPDDVAAKRERIRETLKVLQLAARTLDELPLEAETVEKGYNLDTDATGLPKIHGLPSFYSTTSGGSDYGASSPSRVTATTTRRLYSGGELPHHPNADGNGNGSPFRDGFGP